MALLMLRPALKKTKPVKFAQNSTLVNELARLASAGIPADQLRAAAAQLEQLRANLPQAPGEPAIRMHLEYWAQLTQLADRVDNLAMLGVKFEWYDAWLPPISMPGGPSPSHGDTALESAAVLFNTATLAMQYGEACYLRANAENYRAAAHSFMHAAGLFAAVHERVKGTPDRVSADLREPCLNMLKHLALGHAQRCFYDSAVAQDKKMHLAAIAAATADFYEAAFDAVRDKGSEMSKLLNRSNNYGKWTAVLMVDLLYYRAMASLHAAAMLESTRGETIATELLRLEQAKDMLQRAAKKANKNSCVAQKPNVEAALEKVESALENAQKENNLVYNVLPGELQKMRENREPQPVKGLDMVLLKSENLGDPQSNLAGFGGPPVAPHPIFECILPAEIRHTADEIRLQRSGKIQVSLARARIVLHGHVLNCIRNGCLSVH